MNAVRCVLFDLDGTLIDTWQLYIAAYRATLEPHYGRPVTMQDLARLGPISELRMLAKAVGPAAQADYHRAFVGHYGRLHASLFGGLYPGVADLLSALRARRWPLGVVTGKSRPAWEVTATQAALGPFAVVVTDEQVERPKPDPQGLRLALRRLGLAPGQALYVGDSLADLEAARDAGTPAVGVLWCKSPHEREAFLAAARERGALACLDVPQALLPDRPAGGAVTD